MHTSSPLQTDAAPLRLLCVLAHPDDESLAMGGMFARYAAEGVATFLITATRGEQGWQGSPATNPGPEALGRLREAELRAAAAELGLREVTLLGYDDGSVAAVDWHMALSTVVTAVRRIRPHVVVTFGPDGATGHPDHIAISQITTAALVCAADPGFVTPGEQQPCRVDKLYYLADSRERTAAYDAAFGASAMVVDAVARRAPGWEPWAITTRIDARAYVAQARRAIACHRSQLSEGVLDDLSAKQDALLWGTQEFYRVFSMVNGGSAAEDDLFAGLRPVLSHLASAPHQVTTGE